MPPRGRGRRQVRRRQFKRKVNRMMRKKRSVPAVHRITEWAQLADISVPLAATSGAGAGGVMSFKLGDLSNSGHIAGLFDLYKITGVRLKIVPKWNTNQLSTGQMTSGNTDYTNGVSTLPMFYIAPNHDPAVPAPVAVSDILNDDYCKILRPTRPFNVYIKNPKPLLNSYNQDGSANGNVFIQYNNSSKALQPWLTTGGNLQKVDQSAYPHYGFRWFVESSVFPAGSFHVYAKYYVSLKEQD